MFNTFIPLPLGQATAATALLQGDVPLSAQRSRGTSVSSSFFGSANEAVTGVMESLGHRYGFFGSLANS